MAKHLLSCWTHPKRIVSMHINFQGWLWVIREMCNRKATVRIGYRGLWISNPPGSKESIKHLENLPIDVKVVGVNQVYNSDEVQIILESVEFDAVTDGEKIPMLEVEFLTENIVVPLPCPNWVEVAKLAGDEKKGD